MIRIRLHGRGGQGIKTAGRIAGTAAFLSGHEVQDAPIYGAERRGAPVVSHVRISNKKILQRGVISEPDFILVGDETLIADPQANVLSGHETASALFVNSPKGGSLEAIADVRIICADLTALTIEKLGRASSLSAALGSATVRLAGCAGKEALADAVKEELAQLEAPEAEIQKNIELAQEVFGLLRTVDRVNRQPGKRVRLRAVPYDGAFSGTPSILAPGNASERRTGAWRFEKPDIDYEACTRCGLCFVHCPDGAVALDEEGYPLIDFEHCKGCMICRQLCPVHAIRTEKEVRAW